MAQTSGIRQVGTFKVLDKLKRMDHDKQKLMDVLANESLNHFLQGFRRGGGMTDKSRGGWEKRRKPDPRPGGAILVKSGDLRSDIDTRKVTKDTAIIATQRIPYAARHNEGGRGIRKREFIGESKSLEKKHTQEINKFMKELLEGK